MIEQNDIEKLINKANDEAKKYQKKLQTVFNKAVKKYFKKHKKIKGVTWAQYTPYFNDGESCEFTVHEMVPLTKSMIDNDIISAFPDREDGAYQTDWGAPCERPMVKAEWEKSHITLDEWKMACKDLDLIASLPDCVFKEAFGDHCKVTLTRKSVNVEEFDHD